MRSHNSAIPRHTMRLGRMRTADLHIIRGVNAEPAQKCNGLYRSGYSKRKCAIVWLNRITPNIEAMKATELARRLNFGDRCQTRWCTENTVTGTKKRR
jgi:hypothetical protein